LLGGEPTEGGHGDHALPRQRVPGPVAAFDDEDERLVALVADREFVLTARLFEQNLTAARHERRDDFIGADVVIRFGASLDGAKPIGARRQFQIKTLGGMRRNLALKLDMPRGALPQQAHLAVGKWTNPGRGMESQLDVAAEIALIVDVAGGAMRAFGQVLKSAHAGLRATAARAEQLPSHRHDAFARRGQEHLDCMVGRRRPEFRQRHGTNAAQIDDRRMPQIVDEVWRKSMRSGIAREFGAERIESLAGGGLRQVLDAPAGKKRGTVALANEPLDRRRGLGELGVEDACVLPNKAQEAGGLGLAAEDQPAAFTFCNELTHPLPPPHRAVLVFSDLGKAMALLPFAKILLPSRREKPELATHEAVDTALLVDPFLKPIGGKAAQLPKSGGVGDKGPKRRRRLSENMLAAVAVDGAAIPLQTALPNRPWGVSERAPKA
jgi:hypothetical protein